MFDPKRCCEDFGLFCDTVEIRRTGDIAEIIIDTYRPEEHGGKFPDDAGKLVRLLGFEIEADLTDFEILEAGHEYLIDFINQSNGD